MNVEIFFFQTLQKTLFKSSFLIYFDKKLMLYINFDINKDFEFETMIYYVFENIFKNAYSLRFNIRFIFFLNRLLRDIKTRY